MTTTEHLDAIVARCTELLLLAEKRTQGKWEYDPINDDLDDDSNWVGNHNSPVCNSILSHDATYIAACPGSAEAGWRATIRYIKHLKDLIAAMEEPYYGAAIYEVNQLITDWTPETLNIKQQ